jgi:hypothetical protein
MVDIQTVSIMLASASVIAGVVYYALQIRHQTKIRQTDLAIRINPLFNLNAIEFQRAALKVISLEFKDYDDFNKKYGSLSTEAPESIAVHTMMNFFEGIGNLLKNNLVSIDLVWTYYGEADILIWEKIRPLAKGLSKQLGFQLDTPAEYLYNEMKKRKQKLQQSKV